MNVINPPNVNLSQIAIDAGLDLSGGDYDITMKAARTVDGRDVSDVEAGATTDQTDTEIFDIIKTRYGVPLYLDYSLFSVVQGTFTQENEAQQTKFHHGFVTQAGFMKNTTQADADEIKITNLKLKAGRWIISIAYMTTTVSGIMEVLHGVTSLGTVDQYAAEGYNDVGIVYLNLNAETTADLRIKVNSKNGSSSGYRMRISYVKIEQVAADES